MVVLDIVDEAIRYVEVLDRPDVGRILDEMRAHPADTADAGSAESTFAQADSASDSIRRESRTFIGFIWVGDDAGARLCVEATTADEAVRMVEAEYGEGHAISIWNEADASRPR